jgi:hypothetical protein
MFCFFLAIRSKIWERFWFLLNYGRLQKRYIILLKFFQLSTSLNICVSTIVIRLLLASLCLLLFARNFTSLNLTIHLTKEGNNLYKLVNGRAKLWAKICRTKISLFYYTSLCTRCLTCPALTVFFIFFSVCALLS